MQCFELKYLTSHEICKALRPALIVTQDHGYSQAGTTPKLLKWNFLYHRSHKSSMAVSSVTPLEFELAVSLCFGTLHGFTMNASLKWLLNIFEGEKFMDPF